MNKKVGLKKIRIIRQKICRIYLSKQFYILMFFPISRIFFIFRNIFINQNKKYIHPVKNCANINLKNLFKIIFNKYLMKKCVDTNL